MYIDLSTGITDLDKLTIRNIYILLDILNSSLRQAIFSNLINIIYYENNILYMYYILRKQRPRSVAGSGTQSA
jgi:hypothetical protein